MQASRCHGYRTKFMSARPWSWCRHQHRIWDRRCQSAKSATDLPGASPIRRPDCRSAVFLHHTVCKILVFSAAHGRPFRGTSVPVPYYHADPRLSLLMVDVSRRVRMTLAPGGDSPRTRFLTAPLGWVLASEGRRGVACVPFGHNGPDPREPGVNEHGLGLLPARATRVAGGTRTRSISAPLRGAL
jgi:hypothetical protein